MTLSGKDKEMKEVKRNFTPRLSEPSKSDKHWVHTSRGGLNECIHIGGGSCLPNCVGYAWGRFYEITGKRPRLSRANAEMWYGYTADGYKRSGAPALGAVVCWSKGQVGNEADGAGHVAVVERIEANGDIVTSNSAYGGARFYTKTYKNSEGYNFGAYKFQGFILPPDEFNGASEPASGKKKSVSEIADEVTAGKWGNGEERKRRLTAAGYDYGAVQTEVNRKSKSAGGGNGRKSVSEIADEVIAGKWGNGEERKKAIIKAGYDYGDVQEAVNRKL